MSISMLQGKMLQKVDTLYSFVLFLLDVVFLYLCFSSKHHVSRQICKMFHIFTHYILGCNVSREHYLV